MKMFETTNAPIPLSERNNIIEHKTHTIKNKTFLKSM